MKYQLYALRYGKQEDVPLAEAFTFPIETGFGTTKFEYFFWLAKSATKTILIDCGFSLSEGTKRGRYSLALPNELIGELGIDVSDVTDVLLTHLHYDHAGNLSLFPNAKIHLHSKEWAWVSDFSKLDPQQAKFYEAENISEIHGLLDEGRVHVIDQDVSELFGMNLTRVGGHCPGQLIVEVPTIGGNVLLASDASHLADNSINRNPFPIYEDLEQALVGLDHIERLRTSGALVIAGHDAGVIDRHVPCGTSGNIVALHKELIHA